MKIENLFLIIALFFGIIYVFILPPFQSVDEAAHFYRGYEIISNKHNAQNINGKIGDYLPSSLEKTTSEYTYLIKNIDAKTNLNMLMNSSKIKLDSNKTKFIEFTNTALYSPICYLPQLPGMYIAQMLNLSPLIILYAGRLSNLFFFVAIVYLALKTMPFFKLPMMLLALMPMTLSVSSALTSDVVVIGLNFLWVALILKVLDSHKINSKDVVSFLLMSLMLSLSKYYFLLIPLVLLLPKNTFKNFKQYILFIISVILIAIAGVIIWHNFTANLTFNMNQNANAALQLNFILIHPFAYLLIVLKTLLIKTPRIIITMIGVLGWQDTSLDFLTYILYPILICFSLIIDELNFKFSNGQLCLLFVDVTIAVVSIFTCMYLMWTCVSSGIILGLNGKYFIPIMMPILLLFKNKLNANIKNIAIINLIKILIFAAVILILLSSDLSILHRFYNITPNLYYKI